MLWDLRLVALLFESTLGFSFVPTFVSFWGAEERTMRVASKS